MKLNARTTLCAAAAAALALVVPFAVAHEGAGDHKHAPPDALAVTAAVLLGEGDLTYQTVPNWTKIPGDKQTLGPTHGSIVVDKAGNIYFSMDGPPHGILIYKPDGTFVKGIADGINGIHGMVLREEDGQEYIYAAHLAGKQALKMKTDGEMVWKIGVPTESGHYDDPGKYNPTSIAVGPDGRIYIADGYGQNYIHIYDKDQKYVKSFGGPGGEPGKFTTCHGIGIDTRGDKPLLLVCDRENRRLQHFDLDGNFVAVITENLRRPCSVSFHGDHVAIAELEARVTVIGKDNKPVVHLGDNPEKGHWANYGVPPEQWKPGIFTAPHGVSFDHDGNLYVMDWNASGRVSKLVKAGAEDKKAEARAE